MDFKSLQLFDSLAKNLHFGRTSDQENISPSALSRTIQRLESELGVQLLIRDNRSVKLTAQGEMLREFSERIIQEWKEVQIGLSESTSRLSGKLTLFASVTASQSILPKVLAQFRETWPHIHIQLETGYAVNAIHKLRQGCDVVVAALPESEDRSLAIHIITSTPILAIAPLQQSEFSQVLKGSAADWSKIPLILPTEGQARDNINQWANSKKLKLNIYSEVAGNEAVLSLVALGCGVGFVPKLVIENSPLGDKVVAIPSGPQFADFHIGFCTQTRALEKNPLVRAFWDVLAKR